MKPDSILVRVECDLRRLPINAKEAFLVSQLDGKTSLEEASAMTGISLDEVLKLADRLSILGAVKDLSVREEPARASKSSARRVDPRAEVESMPPPKTFGSRTRRPSRPTRRVSKAAPSKEPETCELDPASQANAKLAACDAAPPPPPSTSAARTKKPSAARRLSKGGRKSLAAVTASAPKPIEAAAPTTLIIEKRAAAPPESVAVAPPTDPAAETGKFRRFKEAAQALAGATRAEPLIKAGDEALRSGDVVTAANNYRIALTMHDDPFVRQKLHAIEAQSRDLRYEKHVNRARSAERAERWDEAAELYQRAMDLRREASCAERAAYAIRMGRGDLATAAKLGEQAVELDGKNAECRVTLGEIYLATGGVARAKAESDVALSLAPNNARAKALAAIIRERG